MDELTEIRNQFRTATDEYMTEKLKEPLNLFDRFLKDSRTILTKRIESHLKISELKL